MGVHHVARPSGCMRISVSSWRTTDDDVDRSVAAIRAAVDRAGDEARRAGAEAVPVATTPS